MNALFWNIRGFGNIDSQNMLRHHVLSFRPRWLALVEPKIPSSQISDSFWSSLGLRFLGANVRNNSLPNIWVLEETSITGSSIIFSSSQSVVIKVNWLHCDFILAFIHGHSDYICRRTLWQDLLSIQGLPVCLLGDFNAVLGAHERSAGSPSRVETWDFQSFINDGDFLDLPSVGPFFTWSNHRFSHGYLETRIDRVLATQSFIDLWEAVNVKVGLRACSDHSPLFLGCSPLGVISKPRPFRFQVMWLSHKACEDLIKQSWNSPLTAMGACSLVQRKLKRLKTSLREWNLTVFGDIKVRITEAKTELEGIQQLLASSDSPHVFHGQELVALRKLNEVLHQESIFLRQKCRASWLKDGDRNTSFFHRSLKIRQGKMGISILRIGEDLSHDATAIKNHIIAYYEQLFTQNPAASSSFDGLEGVIHPVITNGQNHQLLMVPTEEDIRNVVFGMSPDSAPGPDGFGGRFYQSMWHIIGPETCAAIRAFFVHGSFPSGLNSSFVTLIPKVQDAVRIEDYRPIVLGNFLYKIITKILADRLGPILSATLSFHQFGFIPGRRIHDCIALASEGVNGLGRRCSNGNLILKVDIRKAFDTLRWSFLLRVLSLLGFSPTFVAWIDYLLHSAKLSILINGAPEGYFSCSQGVRQGDPLSPLLFCVAEEVLSKMIARAANSGELSSLFLGRNISFPSHLLYADDVIVFCRATQANCRALLRIFTQYAAWSGQVFNPQKSRAYFSTYISRARRLRMCRLLGIVEGSLPFTYLGVPLFRGAPRVRHLQALADSIISKFSKWKGSSLSMAGRVCLVQSVIQGAFVHSMMIYRWPVSLLKRMEASIRNFVFTGNILKKAIVSVSWKKCCAPKLEGGLGLRSLFAANLSYLARLTWDIWVAKIPYLEVFRHRFLRGSQLRSYVTSSIWFGFRDCLPKLASSTRWLVSQGSTIRFWLDNWLGYIIADRVGIPDHLRSHFEFTISDYWTPLGWLISDSFRAAFPAVTQDVLDYHLAPMDSDKCIWTETLDGAISSKAAYHFFREHYPEATWGSWIWSSFIPPRRSTMVWKAVHGSLPTWEKLQTRGFIGPSVCIFCFADLDCHHHFLVSCSFAIMIWQPIFDLFQVPFRCCSSFGEFLLYAMSFTFSPQVLSIWKLTFITTCWALWTARNRFLFENIVISKHAILLSIWSLVGEADSFSLGVMSNSQSDLQVLHSFRIKGCPRRFRDIIEVRWYPPGHGWVKCNTDGSSMGAPGDSTAAGVFRDSSGVVLGCFVRHVGCLFAFEAELIASMHAILIAFSRGWHHLWLESDSSYVVNLLSTRSSQVPWKYRNQWLQILECLNAMEFKVSHIYREGNSVADALSNLATDGFWDTAPASVCSLVFRDMFGLPYYRFPQH